MREYALPSVPCSASALLYCSGLDHTINNCGSPPLQSVFFGNRKGSPVGLLNDKSREHVGVAKPKSAFDPNAAEVGHFDLLLLGHSSFVVGVQLLPVFILQEYPSSMADSCE